MTTVIKQLIQKIWFSEEWNFQDLYTFLLFFLPNLWPFDAIVEEHGQRVEMIRWRLSQPPFQRRGLMENLLLKAVAVSSFCFCVSCLAFGLFSGGIHSLLWPLCQHWWYVPGTQVGIGNNMKRKNVRTSELRGTFIQLKKPTATWVRMLKTETRVILPLKSAIPVSYQRRLWWGEHWLIKPGAVLKLDSAKDSMEPKRLEHVPFVRKKNSRSRKRGCMSDPWKKTPVCFTVGVSGLKGML